MIVTLIGASAGCDDDGGGTSEPAPADLEPALGALCDLFERCPSFYPLATRNRRECTDVLYWVLTCRMVEEDDEITGLRRAMLSLTREQSQMCAGVIGGLACEDLGSSLDTSMGAAATSCMPLFRGLSDDDDSSDLGDQGCRYTSDCPAGLYCPEASFDELAHAPSCRACRGPYTQGERCTWGSGFIPCAEGLVCADDGSGTTICGDRLADGGPCVSDEQCSSGFCDYEMTVCSSGRGDDALCSDDHWCQSGYCHAYSQFDKRCARDGGLGASCGGAQTCLSPLACIDGTCAPPRELGEACASPDQCKVGYCDSDGRCGIVDGGSCDLAENFGRCRSGRCDGVMCLAFRALGEPCESSGECSVGWCNYGDGRCGIPDGQSCQFMIQYCRSGFCDPTLNVCTHVAENGQACGADTECASGYCALNTATCADDPGPLPVGAACRGPEDCATGLCDGTCYERCYENASCVGGEFCDWQSQRCIPKRSDGTGCQDDEECAGGFCNDGDVCATKPDIGDACSGYSDCYPLGYCKDGVCAARRRPDEACDRQDACLEPFLCLEGTCQLINLRCEPAPVGEGCAYLRFCADGGYCNPLNFRCEPQKGAGEPCTQPEECLSDLHCNFSAPTGPSCEAAIAEGAACDGSVPCARGLECTLNRCSAPQRCESSADCSAGSYCDDGRCAAHAQAGERCIGDPDDKCAPGLYCDIDCEPRPGMGQTCDSFTPCVEGLRCDRDARTCQPALDAGAACSDLTDCKPGLRCESGTCQARAGFGQSCYYDGQCESGICFEEVCSAARACQPAQ